MSVELYLNVVLDIVNVWLNDAMATSRVKIALILLIATLIYIVTQLLKLANTLYKLMGFAHLVINVIWGMFASLIVIKLHKADVKSIFHWQQALVRL